MNWKAFLSLSVGNFVSWYSYVTRNPTEFYSGVPPNFHIQFPWFFPDFSLMYSRISLIFARILQLIFALCICHIITRSYAHTHNMSVFWITPANISQIESQYRITCQYWFISIYYWNFQVFISQYLTPSTSWSWFYIQWDIITTRASMTKAKSPGCLNTSGTSLISKSNKAN